MDTLLVGLVSDCIAKALSLGLTSTNKVTLSVGSSPASSILIFVSNVEPIGSELPQNTLWIPSDVNSLDYAKMLRRSSAIPSGSYQNTYSYPTNYTDVMNTLPVYSTGNGFIRAAESNHGYSIGNAHGASAAQLGAVNVSGDQMLGPLRVRANWASVPLATNEFPPLQRVTQLLGQQTNGFNSILFQMQLQLNTFSQALAALTARVEALENLGGGQINPNLIPRTYIHDQVEPADQWIVNHQLGSKDLVVQIWTAVETLNGDILELVGNDAVYMPDEDFILIEFSMPLRGKVTVIEIGISGDEEIGVN